MKTKNMLITLGVLILVLVALSGYLIPNTRQVNQEMADEIPIGMHRMPDGTMMHDSAPGMGHMMDMLVTSERAFIEGMIPHHQEAVDTAREVLERGATTPEIRRLVENIIVAQEKEIAEMQSWYEAWYGEPYIATGEYVPMMRDLTSLRGVELDRVFLQDMIMHHMGAIMMAQSVEAYIEHQEIEILTQAIIDTQSSEISEMQRMLQSI